MNIKAIVIRGDFTEQEFAAVVATVRRLDEQRPDARFEIVAVDPTDTGLEIARQTLERAIPPLPGHSTTFATIATPRRRRP